MKSNPWGLAPREAKVMTLMLARGSQKGVARAMGISINTVVTYLREARRKMAPPHKLAHFLMWDRWLQSQIVAQAAEQMERAQQIEPIEN